jgi:hypothetical protein
MGRLGVSGLATVRTSRIEMRKLGEYWAALLVLYACESLKFQSFPNRSFSVADESTGA